MTKQKERKIPKRYLPKGLSKADREKQKKSILKGTNRPKVDSVKSKESTWTKKARQYFKGETPTLSMLSKASKVPVKVLKQIIDRGEAAYYSSGSRPNVSATQWGRARLYAVLFGSKGARKADNDLIEKHKIPILTG